MALKFWTGCAGSGKSTKLYNYIIDESMKYPELTYIVVVPEQFNLQAQQDIVRLHPRHGILNIDVVSFTRLAHRIFEETGYGADGGEVIDDMGKNLILRRIAQIHKDELPVLGGNLDKLGYITQVKSAISEFMQYGISVEDANTFSEDAKDSGKGQLATKLKDIAFLYSEFLNSIKDKYTTREELMLRLAAVLPESEKVKKYVFAFDGFTGFTPVQLNVIENLLVLSKDVHVAITIDKREKNTDDVKITEHELFYLGKRTLSQLGRIADRNHIVQLDSDNIVDEIPVRFLRSGSAANHSEMLTFLERKLYRGGNEVYQGEININDEIHVLCGLNPEEEMELNALKIDRLIKEKGYKYSEIAIITGDIETYRGVIERTLKLHGIPYFTDKTQPVLLNPMIEYLRAAINVISDNYTYESIFRLLKTGLTDIDRADIDELENYCIATGVKGRSVWKRTFSKLPNTHKKDKAEEKADYLLNINKQREKVCNLFEKLENDLADGFTGRNKVSAKCYSLALYKMLERERIGQKLKDKSEWFDEQGKSDEARAYEQIFERVMHVLEQISQLLDDEKLTIREFGQLMDAGLDEIRIGIIPQNMDYVQVGDLTRSRLKDIRALFLIGVNDGIIPAAVASSGLISDSDKDFLMDKHEGVMFAPTARENAYTQQLYIYMMLTKPREYLSLSYSKINAGGESHRASYLIKTIQTMFPGVETEYMPADVKERISGAKPAFKVFTELFESYMNGDISQRHEIDELISFMAQNDRYYKKIAEIIDASKKEYGDERDESSIGHSIASLLYGKKLYASVTRLETYAKCAYQYYLKYGLELKEREEYDFAANDLGTVFHAALEKYAGMLIASGTNIADVDDETSLKYIEEAVEFAVASEDMSALYSTKRQAYLVKRIKRIMNRTVSVLKYQTGKGLFRPYNVEVDFSRIDDLDALNLKLSEDESLKMSGKIDRIDTYNENDKTYVRIIDYKSGNKNLDIAAVYEGRELQLVVYLDAAMEMIKKETNASVIPAGILYYHIDDPMLKESEVGSVSEIEAKVRKELKMKGYVNSEQHIVHLMDSECDGVRSDVIPAGFKKNSSELYADSKVLTTVEFDDAIKGAQNKIIQMGRDILDGKISTAIEQGFIDKYPKTCDYCDFKSVCHQRTGLEDEDVSEANDDSDNVEE